ncbi:MAG: hypothetical protein ACRYFX_19605 [Janthinobacterium lividum]
MPHLPTPAGNQDLVLALVIVLCSALFGLVGWFIVRTLKQVEDAIHEGKAETAALRTELSAVTANLKDYAGQVERQSEELGSLKKAYAALERAFHAMDKWLYGQAVQGKLPMPPDFKASTPDAVTPD